MGESWVSSRINEIISQSERAVSSMLSALIFLIFPRPQKVKPLAVDECVCGRDYAQQSPAVRKANPRNQVASRDFPWDSTSFAKLQ